MEPLPRVGARPAPASLPPWPLVTQWPKQVASPERDFLATLGARRSKAGAAVVVGDLAALLRHATMLRSRHGDGRFGTWESRSAPSAGGLHGIRLVVLAIEEDGPSGLYDDNHHGLRAPSSLHEPRELNRTSVSLLTGAGAGTTIQLIADRRRYDDAYENASSLMWRDAGALSATVALVATALSLRSVLLGRHGDDILRAGGIEAPWQGVGAVHIGGDDREALLRNTSTRADEERVRLEVLRNDEVKKTRV